MRIGALDGVERVGGKDADGIYEAALEALPDACTLSVAVRDQAGAAVDMRLVWMNELARSGQPDPDGALGRMCSELWPQMVDNGSFAACLRVLDSGQAEQGDFAWTQGQAYATSTYSWSARRVGNDHLLWVLKNGGDKLRRTLENESRLKTILATAPDAIIVIDENSIIVSANTACNAIFGWDDEELVGQDAQVLMDDDELAGDATFLETYVTHGPTENSGKSRDVLARHKSGELIPVRLSIGEARVGDQRVFTAIMSDLRQRQALEERLRHAQKMEVVGRLVATVAHDFNNLLTVTTAAASILDQVTKEPFARELIEEISEAAQRGTSLVSQLMGFSRAHAQVLKLVDPLPLVTKLHRAARRLAGPHIDVRVEAPASPWMVRADVIALERAFLNLIANARDAMAAGGTMTLGLDNVGLESDTAEGAAGPRVRFYVRDTGVGMTADVRARALEPFFTTKSKGRGTGLGLSSVADVISRMGGELTIESEVGKGTCVMFSLPRAAQRPPVAEQTEPLVSRGAESLLLVDDDPAIRRVFVAALQRKGYAVQPAASFAEAVAAFEAEQGRFDVLISDVTLPDGDGRTLVRVLIDKAPALRSILISGFASAGADLATTIPKGTAYLPKPFSVRQLALQLRRLIDHDDAPAAPEGSSAR